MPRAKAKGRKANETEERKHLVAMSSLTSYNRLVSPKHKPLAIIHGVIKTPPMSRSARIEAGYLLRLLQRGDSVGMPHSRPMPAIGVRCHELRVIDENKVWRIVYRIDSDAVVIPEVFEKKTQKTPKRVISVCKRRLKEYDDD